MSKRTLSNYWMASPIKFTFFILASALFVLLFLFVVENEDQEEKKRMREILMRKDSLLILIWNPRKLRDWNSYPKLNRTNYPGECGKLCYFTHYRDLMDEADAVTLFAVDRDGYDSDLQSLESGTKNQLRVFWLTEASPFLSPGANYVSFPNEVAYNWTMTYRRDSDVFLAYSYITRVTLETREQEQMALQSPIEKELRKSLEYRFLSHKTKVIAWTVSHCQTESRREDLVKKLIQYLPPQSVDIYGDCGDKKCSTANSRHGGNWSDCYKEIGRVYKFYLSFENALCFDYITEKFFYALESGMVPIVYGGSNYNLYGPPGSFINVEDFKSVEELAKYLIYLNETEEEYLKYFLWKDKYRIWKKDRLCSLCEKMWAHSKVITKTSQGPSTKRRRVIDPRYSKVYSNISSWWNFKPVESLSGGNMVKENVCREVPGFLNF